MNNETSNCYCENPWVVQAWCSGQGWMDSKYGGETQAEAQEAAEKLVANDSSWMPGTIERKVRVVPRTKIKKEYR